MDGVVYRGDRAIPEAISFLEMIRDYPYLFLTNNSSTTPEAVLDGLVRLGVRHCGIENILTSAMATAGYLQQVTPGFTYYAVGGPGLHAALAEYGTADEDAPDYVVVGEGEGLDYHVVTMGITMLLRGRSKLIGTNLDVNLDGTYNGRPAVLPGCGALIAPFQVGSGMDPLFIGKPSPMMIQQGLKGLGKKAGEVFMIGDRPETDIKGAAQIGIRTILVTTGRFNEMTPIRPLPRSRISS
ncbi:MAG: HAD-IIA family hydrolase [Desulfobacteraceae bacterium]|nr:HAD-IIA family hydrolase [Desulfobacteraceae bacterium]